MAIGVLGLSPADLSEMEFSEVQEAVIARFAYDQFQDRQAWERMRIAAFYSVSPYMKKGANQTPAELVPLSWDKGAKAQQRPQTTEGMRKYYKKEIERLRDS